MLKLKARACEFIKISYQDFSVWLSQFIMDIDYFLDSPVYKCRKKISTANMVRAACIYMPYVFFLTKTLTVLGKENHSKQIE